MGGSSRTLEGWNPAQAKKPKSHDFRHDESEQVHQLYNQGRGLLRILHLNYDNVME